MKLVKEFEVTFGCDPEFFFSRDGKVIGSEKVLPKEGIEYQTSSEKVPSNGTVASGKGIIIRDGVQAELNPRANTCRANLGNEIAYCFGELYRRLKLPENKGVEINFAQQVEVPQDEFDSLSNDSKRLGCMPSFNAYDEHASIPAGAGASLSRCAGGHLHLSPIKGIESAVRVKEVLKDWRRLVPMLDLIVGNTCVLIDRDAGNIIRRKTYGRAGEFRKPHYGIEYRTLSNFWLGNYLLMSLVTGLARQAVSICASSSENDDIAKRFMDAVNIDDVKNAINNNDYELARKNFKKIKPLLRKYCRDEGSFPLSRATLSEFEFFVSRKLGYWFKENPLEHWTNLEEAHDIGFENFLMTTVHNQLKIVIGK